MNTLQVSTRLINLDNKPASGISVVIEIYQIEKAQWEFVAQAISGAQGKIKAVIDMTKYSMPLAPSVRLRELARSDDEILAQGGSLNYKHDAKILFVDFGLLVRLAEHSYLLQSSQKQPQPGTIKISASPYSDTARAGRTDVLTSGGVTPVTDLRPKASTDLLQDKYRAELLGLQTKLSGLNIELKDKRALLTKNNNQITALNAQLRTSQDSVNSLTKTLETINKNKEKTVKFDSLISHVGSSIDHAKKQGSSYRLGKVKLELKGVFDKDENDDLTVLFPALDDFKDKARRGEISTLTMDVMPINPRDEHPDQLLVPDVSGLSESAVNRVLQSIGAKLVNVYQSVKPDSNLTNGHSIKQMPAPGSVLPEDRVIRVIFIRHTVTTEVE